MVGSKKFNENYILGEMIAQMLEADGIDVDRLVTLRGQKQLIVAKNHHVEVGGLSLRSMFVALCALCVIFVL